MDLLNSKRLFLLTFVVALFSYSFVFGLDITNEVNGSCVYDGDSVTLSKYVEPLHGTLSQNGNNFTYSPFANANGSDTFTLTANDGNGGTDVDSRTSTITNIPPATATYAKGPFKVSYSPIILNTNSGFLCAEAILTSRGIPYFSKAPTNLSMCGLSLSLPAITTAPPNLSSTSLLKYSDTVILTYFEKTKST